MSHSFGKQEYIFAKNFLVQSNLLKMWSWSAIAFRTMILIHVMFVVLLYLAGSYRMEQLNRYILNNGTGHNESIPGTDIQNNTQKHHDEIVGPIAQRLNQMLLIYFFIALGTVLQILFGLLVTIPGFTDENTEPTHSQLNCYSVLGSLVNLALCITMVALYHADIGADLDGGLDIHDMIGDKHHSIELSVGLIGIAINVSALISTFFYDIYLDVIEPQERVRLLAAVN